ncbi:MAG: phosphatidate cytidylyltransferase [Planctomycetes bacterium]|nr:phosphatidate cytidylyltransferase [Planctomycetota bacterium]
MSAELRNRLVFGVVFAALVVGAITADLGLPGHFGVLAMALLLAVPAGREYARLARAVAPQARLAPVLVVSLLLVAEAWAHSQPAAAALIGGLPLAVCLIALGLVWTAIQQMARLGIEGVFANLGATMLGILYIGVPFSLVVRLACIEGPPEAGGAARGGLLLIMFLAAVKLGDVAAFFGGRSLGRHKMCPGISPGKTWEGFACSFIGSVGGSFLVAWLCQALSGHSPFAGWWQPLVWGLVLGPLGAMGDLVESCFKRAAAMKDSGASMPGFGGVLDLYDAVVLAIPVAYLLALVL